MSETLQVRFHYIKANDYNEKPIHGVFGGPTPQRELFMALFSERLPIPTAITYEISPLADGVGVNLKEVEREGRVGPIRLVHSGFHLSVGTAIALRDWLTGHIEGLQDAPVVDGNSSAQPDAEVGDR